MALSLKIEKERGEPLDDMALVAGWERSKVSDSGIETSCRMMAQEPALCSGETAGRLCKDNWQGLLGSGTLPSGGLKPLLGCPTSAAERAPPLQHTALLRAQLDEGLQAAALSATVGLPGHGCTGIRVRATQQSHMHKCQCQRQ